MVEVVQKSIPVPKMVLVKHRIKLNRIKACHENKFIRQINVYVYSKYSVHILCDVYA